MPAPTGLVPRHLSYSQPRIAPPMMVKTKFSAVAQARPICTLSDIAFPLSGLLGGFAGSRRTSGILRRGSSRGGRRGAGASPMPSGRSRGSWSPGSPRSNGPRGSGIRPSLHHEADGRLAGGLDGLTDFGDVGAAALGRVGLAAAFSADDGRGVAEPVAGLEAFGDERLGDGADDGDLAAGLVDAHQHDG